MTDDSSGEIALADEILQVMYWMRGEDLAQTVTARDLTRMITAADEAHLNAVLERLARQGLVASLSRTGSYSLTEAGVREGGRRFADEFADLTKPGHGECGDPDCDCHRTGSTDNCLHRVGHAE